MYMESHLCHVAMGGNAPNGQSFSGGSEQEPVAGKMQIAHFEVAGGMDGGEFAILQAEDAVAKGGYPKTSAGVLFDVVDMIGRGVAIYLGRFEMRYGEMPIMLFQSKQAVGFAAEPNSAVGSLKETVSGMPEWVGRWGECTVGSEIAQKSMVLGEKPYRALPVFSGHPIAMAVVEQKGAYVFFEW
ncbi:hypothetical protein HMPREF6485_2184 [Segatella buccae ATCC 33574]|uniref:Uncharacterized protein n=1 Tax=Segatella buccae ATCC 33574 TaxID=873513 RepID=E6K998_9BACT|nr:hypothetical protein HMPREF6485_2184 [Segatella buccae ATCC 33574]